MEHKLKYKLKLSTDIEHDTLYKWFIREFDDEGEQVGQDYIPWQWPMRFRTKSLGIVSRLNIENGNLPFLLSTDQYDLGESEENANTDIYQENIEAGFMEIIAGNLEPVSFRGPNTRYSMLGSDRKITDFGIMIEKHDQDRCQIWGSPSYTTEIDFRNEFSPDAVQINLLLTPDKFEKILNLVKSNKPNNILVSLSRVRGFYSNWSPGISTDEIKILTEGKDHEVQFPDDCKINPPRLGQVGDFKLELSTPQEVVVEDKNETDNEFDDVDNERPDDPPGEMSLEEKLIPQFSLLQKAIRKLYQPLWAIVALIILILFKLW